MSGSKRDQRRNQVIGQGFGVQTVPAASLGELDMALFGDIPELTGNSITQLPNGEVQIGNFTLTARGLAASEGVTYEEWNNVGLILRHLEGSLQWLLGDWIVMGEFKWGETYKQLMVESDYSYQTLRDYAYVAGAIDLSIRNRHLSFSHHRLVAAMHDTPDLQKAWLDYAELRGLKIAEFKRDLGLVIHLAAEQQYEVVSFCIENKKRVSDLPEFKEPKKGKPAPEVAQLKTYASYVINELSNLSEMTARQLEQFNERREWIIKFLQGL